MAATTRTILHVDMDAFYTSIEQRDHPELRGKPVIVGADPQKGSGRGVVAAASYEARAFGVRSAMPIGRAYQACPDGVFLRGDMEKYAEVSRRIMAILRSYSDRVEPISIDEAFLDVSVIAKPEKGRALALEVKENIYHHEKLRASVGVAPNKFLAKIASDLEKPDGLVEVVPGKELDFLEPLPIERLWGVGPKTAEKLHQRGFRIISDLWNADVKALGSGKHAEHLLKLARGIDDRPVVSHHEAKSIGHERTYLEDVGDYEVVKKTLLKLADGVATRARKHGVVGQTVTLKFRDHHFVTETRAQTLRDPVDDGSEIYRIATLLLERVDTAKRKVRLIGVSLSNLKPTRSARQLSLFTEPEKKRELDRAQDALRARFGDESVTRASLVRD